MATLNSRNIPRRPLPDHEPYCKVCQNKQYTISAGQEFAVAARCHACFQVCPTCSGAGVLFKEDWTGAVTSKICSCRTVDERLRLFNDATVPRRYINADLNSFDWRDNKSLRDVQLALLKLERDFEPGQKGIGLSGPVGSGKTHLMAAFVREITLSRGIPTVFVEFTHLLASIRAGYDKQQGEANVLEPWIDAPVLIIDELGKGLTTEWQMAILDELVSKRYNRSVTTCFTTNFPYRDRTQSSARSRENFEAVLLEERVGERIFSRISEMCDLHRVDAEDYRKPRTTTV